MGACFHWRSRLASARLAHSPEACDRKINLKIFLFFHIVLTNKSAFDLKSINRIISVRRSSFLYLNCFRKAPRGCRAAASTKLCNANANVAGYLRLCLLVERLSLNIGPEHRHCGSDDYEVFLIMMLHPNIYVHL